MTAASGNLLKVRLGGGTAVQAATTAWVNAVLNKGATVSAIQFALVNQLFYQLNAAVGLANIVDFRLSAVENATQAYTSFIQLLTPTPHNGPTFIPWRGIGYDGVSQYDDWGLVPSSFGSILQPDQMHILSREQTNIASGGDAIGSAQNALINIELAPRSSIDRVVGKLNSTTLGQNAPLIANTDSRKVVGLQRQASVYQVDIDGVVIGNLTPSGADQNASLSNRSTYIMARNNAGTADTFRQGIHCLAMVSTPLTPTQILAVRNAFENYLTQAATHASTAIWVSSVNFGGIPVGSNSNPGTAAAPLLTVSQGYFFTPRGGVLSINGDTAAPTLYQTSFNTTLADQVTWTGTHSRGAILAGYNAAPINVPVLALAPTNGDVLTLAQLIIDPSQNALGANANGIYLLPAATQWAAVFDDVKFQGHTLFALRNSAAGLNVLLSMTDVDFVGGSVTGNVDIRAMVGGSINVLRGSSTITNSLFSSFGAEVYQATVQGVTASFEDHDVSVTADATFVGAGLSGLYLLGIPTAVDGGTYQAIKPTVGAGLNGYPLQISQNMVTDLTQLNINGSSIQNVHGLYNSCYGGGLFKIGEDNADRALAQNCLIANCSGHGDASNFPAGAGHGIFMVNCTNPVAHDIVIYSGGIGMVDKANSDGFFHDLSITDQTSSYVLNKASLRSRYLRISCYAHAGFDGPFINYSVGDNNSAGIYGDGSFDNCYFENDGAVNQTAISHTDARFGLQITNSTFKLVSGSMRAAPFIINGVALTTAQFLALYPTNTVIGF